MVKQKYAAVEKRNTRRVKKRIAQRPTHHTISTYHTVLSSGRQPNTTAKTSRTAVISRSHLAGSRRTLPFSLRRAFFFSSHSSSMRSHKPFRNRALNIVRATFAMTDRIDGNGAANVFECLILCHFHSRIVEVVHESVLPAIEPGRTALS